MSSSTCLTETGRLHFATPLLVKGLAAAVIERLMGHDLMFGGRAEMSRLGDRSNGSAWWDLRASGPDVTGMINDCSGLIADPESIANAFDSFFHQPSELVILGQRYEPCAIISSRTTIYRVGSTILCSLYRDRVELDTGRRSVLMNCGAGDAESYANVIPWRDPILSNSLRSD